VMMSNLVAASRLTIISNSYACEALAAAQQLVRSGNLSKTSVGLSVPYVLGLLNASGVATIDLTCASSAATILGAAMSAASQLNVIDGRGVIEDLMRLLDPTVHAIFARSSIGLQPGETMNLKAGSSSAAQVRRLRFTDGLKEYSLCSSFENVYSCPFEGLGVVFPVSLASDLSLPYGAVFDLLVHTYDMPPSDAAVSPLVAVSLALMGGTPLSIYNLNKPVRITLPVNRKGQFVCVFWDPDTATYSQNGVQTLDSSNNSQNVTCLTNHLGVFRILPLALDGTPASISNESTYTSNSAANPEPQTTYIMSESGSQNHPPEFFTSKSAVDTLSTATIPGLEMFGLVNVLLPAVFLGIPSHAADTVYNLPVPFENIQIQVPKGTWPGSMRDYNAPLLSVTVFSLPQNYSFGFSATGCGPVVCLGPLGTPLSGQLQVSVPCYGTATQGMSPAVFSFNRDESKWLSAALIPDSTHNTINRNGESSAIWAKAVTVGPLVAGWVSTPTMQDKGNHSALQAVIIGTVVGATACFLFVVLAIITKCRQHRFRDKVSEGQALDYEAPEMIADAQSNEGLGCDLVFKSAPDKMDVCNSNFAGFASANFSVGLDPDLIEAKIAGTQFYEDLSCDLVFRFAPDKVDVCNSNFPGFASPESLQAPAQSESHSEVTVGIPEATELLSTTSAGGAGAVQMRTDSSV
jgi:hypothetical protein